MALQDKPKFSLIELFITAKTRVENVAKSDDFVRDPVLNAPEQFPYAQFPCAELTGELLLDPFWEAVKRIENVGLKVHVCTIHVFLFVNHVDIHVIMYYNASWHLHVCVMCYVSNVIYYFMCR